MVADVGDRLPHWQRALAVYNELLAERPDDSGRLRNVALVEKYIGAHYERQLDYAAALEHHRAALRLDEARARRQPDDRILQLDLAIDLSNLAFVQWQQGDLGEAALLYERSLAIREQLAATDPKDMLARGKVAFVRRQLGLVKRDQKRNAEALADLREAVRLFESTDMTADTKRNLAVAFLGLVGLESNRSDMCRASGRAFELLASMTPTERASGLHENTFVAATRAAADCGVARARQHVQPPPQSH
jgi:tetratricopeptide (TPR) repeat protein